MKYLYAIVAILLVCMIQCEPRSYRLSSDQVYDRPDQVVDTIDNLLQTIASVDTELIIKNVKELKVDIDKLSCSVKAKDKKIKSLQHKLSSRINLPALPIDTIRVSREELSLVQQSTF